MNEYFWMEHFQSQQQRCSEFDPKMLVLFDVLIMALKTLLLLLFLFLLCSI